MAITKEILEVPQDRNGEFDPQFVKKRRTRFDRFDDKIISLYARGVTTSEIQGRLEEIYGVEVSPKLIVSLQQRGGAPAFLSIPRRRKDTLYRDNMVPHPIIETFPQNS